MEHQLANRVALDYTTRDTEYSQAVAMEGANAAQPSFVVLEYSLSGGTTKVEVQLQVSNDLENWEDFGTADSATATGYNLGTKHTSVAAAYVRLKYIATATTSGTVAMAVSLNTSHQ